MWSPVWVGADDYNTKPFEGPELVARIRAVLRRLSPGRDAVTHVIEDLEINPEAFICKKRGEPVQLSATEFRLLLELVCNAGRVLTRAYLLRHVLEYEYVGGHAARRHGHQAVEGENRGHSGGAAVGAHGERCGVLV